MKKPVLLMHATVGGTRAVNKMCSAVALFWKSFFINGPIYMHADLYVAACMYMYNV